MPVRHLGSTANWNVIFLVTFYKALQTVLSVYRVRNEAAEKYIMAINLRNSLANLRRS